MMKKMRIVSVLYCFIVILFFFILSAFTSRPVWAASFSLSPATKVVTVGDQFDVAVILDTAGEAATAAKAIVNYDGLKLQVVSATLGSLFTTKTEPDTSTSGKVTLEASGATATESFTGSGTFATLTFKALAAGVVTVSFEFSQSSTTDSNVTGSSGNDILTAASSGTYTIATSGIGGGTESTPVPTPSALPESGVVEDTIILLGGGLLFLGTGLALSLFGLRKTHR
jgi:hypothetical protein